MAYSCNIGGNFGEIIKRGPWTLEEDNLLIHYITCHGEGRWNTLAKFSGLKRTGKSCRLRWLNYLKPDIKRGNLTPQEQILILELHSKWGNRWSKIAQHLPGRTDNEIKNYWRTRVQKQARHLKIDSNSTKFVETIKRFWMPRLLEKVEQNSPLSTSSSSSTSILTTETGRFDLSSLPVDEQAQMLSSSTPQTSKTDNCCLSSNICSPDSTSMVFPEYSDIQTMSNEDINLLLKKNDGYHVNSSNFETRFSHFNMQETEIGDMSAPQLQVAEEDWLKYDDLSSTLWNMDELWQFK